MIIATMGSAGALTWTAIIFAITPELRDWAISQVQKPAAPAVPTNSAYWAKQRAANAAYWKKWHADIKAKQEEIEKNIAEIHAILEKIEV